MFHLPDSLVSIIYFIAVPILGIAGTYSYMKSHTIISNGPEGEAKGCFSVFLSFLIGAVILVTIILKIIEMGIGFLISHWIIFLIGIVIIVILGIIGLRKAGDEVEENDDLSESLEDKKDDE